MPNCAFTCFAPAERADPKEVKRVSHRFEDAGFFGRLMDYLPDAVLLLNPQRQIVYANRKALETGGLPNRSAAIGMRPGELFRCKNLRTPPGECGTTESCRQCGQARAVVASHAGNDAVEECRLLVERNDHQEALDLRVWASPTEFNGEPLTFVALSNIAEEKRRAFLERSFLHDLTNTVMALREFSALLEAQPPGSLEHIEYAETVRTLSERLLQEVRGHQLLIAAENNDLKPNLRNLDSLKLLRRLHAVYNTPELVRGRVLEIEPGSIDLHFTSDEVLVSRVLDNMIKNALEASPEGAKITLACHQDGDMVAFSVHNPTFMPEDVRLQVFYRNFSTKGAGRGLGTYSMKYFTEKYLRGKILFQSTAEEGTTFIASYPLAMVH